MKIDDASWQRDGGELRRRVTGGDGLSRQRREVFRGELRPQNFMTMVKDAAFARLPLEPPTCRINGSLLQLYYFEWPQNYEVSLGVHEHATTRVRFHLAFCGESEENRRRLAFVAEAAPEIMERLGRQVDMYERRYSDGQLRTFLAFTVSREPLTPAFAAEIGALLCGFVEVLEPIVRPLGPLAWSARHGRQMANRKTSVLLS